VAPNLRGTEIVCPAAPEATVKVMPVPVNVMALPLIVNAVVVVESKVRELRLIAPSFWFVGRYVPEPVKITSSPVPGTVFSTQFAAVFQLMEFDPSQVRVAALAVPTSSKRVAMSTQNDIADKRFMRAPFD
jgi:hypothetical protein